MIEVNKKVSKILNDIGIPHSRSCELIDLFDKRNCINSNNFQFVCSHLVVILNILTKIVGNLRHYEHEVPILIKYLDDNERDLNSMDLGVLKHMKAIKTWKIDNDPYFPTLYLNDSIAILEKIGSGEATAYLARIFDTYGQLLVSKGYLNEAKIEFQKALDIKEQSNDEVGLAITTGNIGRLYMQIGDFDKAIRYLKKDYEIIFKTETENSNLKAQLLSTISNCYMQLQKYTTAKENNDKSYILNKSTNNYTGLVFNYLNQAEVNLITKDFKEAKFAINAAEKIINKNLVAQFFIENFRGRIIEIKARILYLEGNFKLSLKLFEEALKIFDIELSFTNVEIAKFLKNFADIAKTVKQNEYSGHLYRRALKYLDSTEEVSCRKEIENELRENHKDSWMLHSAGRYIGHDQIDFLLNNAGATNFVGEEKEVVVLFMDIRGFTSLSEKLDPNQLIEVLNGFLATMTKAITQFGGFVDKFIGDAIMAVF
ncbi:MAG: hypothetical protein K9H16_15335, partial [Bacteroidales bacterium]|nr:hypothetical protein [Bacteroidales bacterium]